MEISNDSEKEKSATPMLVCERDRESGSAAREGKKGGRGREETTRTYLRNLRSRER